MQPREKVEVEARNGHYRIVGILLVRYHDVCDPVPRDRAVVEGTLEVAQETWCSRE